MSKIKNQAELLACGDLDSRRIVLDLTSRVLSRLDSYSRIKELMFLEGDLLKIGKRTWDLSQKDRVYLVGAGKAANAMGRAVDEVLGEHLDRGIIIVKIREEQDRYNRTIAYTGGHPLPSHAGVQACQEILRLVAGAGERDLFIAVISGGSSALMGYPVEGISLEDKIRTADLLIRSGARVTEINAVRRHLSRMNGGRLAQRIRERGAELIGLAIHDVVGWPETGDIGEPASFYGTPIGPDETTFEEALAVIRNYGLEEKLPPGVIDYLRSCGPEDETPKSFSENTYYIINTVPDSCRLAAQAAEEMNLPCLVLTTSLEGESKEAGLFLSAVAKEIKEYARPIAPPCVVVCAGETTTAIDDRLKVLGHGGPSQELVLRFAIAAENVPGLCLLSIDTEGTDGTTLFAGGIVDSTSIQRAKSKALDAREYLRKHSSHELLSQIGDCVFTGNTGTNLCDLNIIYIAG